VRLCTFHPAYGYEDFLEGYRPHAVNDQMLFELRDGIFKRVCADAARHPGTNFYLIIDEINRGDIPRIFGELLTILEMDKRGETIWLPLSSHAFAVTKNVFVIGTMNTADRSIALLDIALRRRFGFIELMPDYSLFGNTVLENSIPVGPWLEALNERLLEFLGRDARNLQIGHAYFLENGRPVEEFGRFATIIQEDILPLLEEYCYEDYESLAKILGNNLVEEKRQRIRRELFASERRDDLIQALLAPAPDLMTSARAVSSTAKTEVSEEDAEEDDEADEVEANAL
jgi:5-methylcytosine-specific restriction enzyme B